MIWCYEVLGASLHGIFMDLPVFWPRLTTPTLFNLTAVIYCHCLMTMALAASRHIGTMFVCVRVCECETIEIQHHFIVQ